MEIPFFMKFDVQNLEELLEVATIIKARILEKKKVLFYGEMGTGKTTFIRMICKSMSVKDQVNSPTFSLINQYDSPHGRIFHSDLYRIKDSQEAFDTGILEMLHGPDFCFIEWPEIIEEHILDGAIWIKIVKIDEYKRSIELLD